MAFKLFKKQNPEDMPPQQRAQKAQISIGIRIVACGYLGYLGIKLLKQAIDGTTGIGEVASWLIPIFFLAIALFLMVNLIVELVRNYKAGVYNAATYADDEEECEDEESIDSDSEISGDESENEGEETSGSDEEE